MKEKVFVVFFSCDLVGSRNTFQTLKFCEAETLRDFILGKTGSQYLLPQALGRGSKKMAITLFLCALG